MAALFPGGDDGYERRKERARRQQAEQSKAGRDIGPLPPVADPERRKACERNLRLYCETYHRPRFPLEWSNDHLKAIAKIEEIMLVGGLYAYAMARGSGKTSLVITAVEWAASYGHRRFPVAVGATGPHADRLLETIKTDFEVNELLAADFPEICYPIRKLEGINNRSAGQVLNGERTRIRWTRSRLVLPTVRYESGELAPSSGVVIMAAGLLGALRGLQFTTADGIMQRPDAAIPDDPQTDESARRPAQTATRLRILDQAIIGLAGPDKRIACCVPCTVIQRGDMADQLLDRENRPEWRGEKTGLLASMPANMDLWRKYREIRQDSLKAHEDIRDATAFYEANRAAMDEGAEASWPVRFQPGQVSAIQYAMDLWARSEPTFWAEYQNCPLEEEQGDIETLKAAELLERFNGYGRGVLPEWAERITAYADIQGDCLPYAVVAWGRDFRGAVIEYGTVPDQPERYWTLRNLSNTLRRAFGQPTVESGIEAGLRWLEQRMQSHEYRTAEGRTMRCGWLGLDANWQAHAELVYTAAKRSPKLVRACAGRFIGAASLPMDQWRKESGCRMGHFWRRFTRGDKPRIEIDGNYWKSFVAERCRAEHAVGITWWGSNGRAHECWADQLSAEYAVRVSGRGRTVSEWRNRPGRDNHYWDALVGAAVGNSELGGTIMGQAPAKPPRPRLSVRAMKGKP